MPRPSPRRNAKIKTMTCIVSAVANQTIWRVAMKTATDTAANARYARESGTELTHWRAVTSNVMMPKVRMAIIAWITPSTLTSPVKSLGILRTAGSMARSDANIA